jgi:hypothetical protein
VIVRPKGFNQIKTVNKNLRSCIMQKITVEKKKLIKIIKKLEKASAHLCSLAAILVLDDEDEVEITGIGRSLGYCQSKLNDIVCNSEKNYY